MNDVMPKTQLFYVRKTFEMLPFIILIYQENDVIFLKMHFMNLASRVWLYLGVSKIFC